MKRYILLLLLISCREEPKLIEESKPAVVADPTPVVSHAEKRLYYILHVSNNLQIFQPKDLECVVSGKRKLEKRMKDSADMYRHLLDSVLHN